MANVFVTGATGFLGSHIVDQLLSQGHKVSVSARSESKAADLASRYKDQISSKQLSTAVIEDMYDPNSFRSALQGIDGVIHVASPLPNVKGSSDLAAEIVYPAIKMTETILVASHQAGIKRLVLTSSFAAVRDPTKGGVIRDYTYSAKDWNPMGMKDLKNGEAHKAYGISKTLAEKAAWDYKESKQPAFDLVVVNPPVIFGPILGKVDIANLNASTAELWQLIDKDSIPVTRLPIYIDVRDAASVHIAALTVPEAKGKRFTIAGPGLWHHQAMADFLRQEFPDQAHRIPVGKPGSDLPPPIAKYDSAEAEKVLGLTFRSWTDSVKDVFPQLFAAEKK